MYKTANNNYEGLPKMEIKKQLPTEGNIEGYYDIPDHIYFETAGLSNSSMGLMLKSPAHYLEGFGHATAAMRLGTLIHVAVLEPNRWAAEVAVMEKADMRTKKGKEYKKEFELAHQGMTIISADEDKTCSLIAANVFSHPTASKLFEGLQAEIAGFKTINGVLCKAKADGWHKDYMVDLKSTKSAMSGFGGFQRSVNDFSYHRQAAHYLDVFYDDPTDKPFYFVAVEKEAPYGVNVFELTPDFIAAGRRQRDKAIKQYKKFFMSGQDVSKMYTGYEAGVHQLDCPTWMKQIETPTAEVDVTLGW